MDSRCGGRGTRASRRQRFLEDEVGNEAEVLPVLQLPVLRPRPGPVDGCGFRFGRIGGPGSGEGLGVGAADLAGQEERVNEPAESTDAGSAEVEPSAAVLAEVEVVGAEEAEEEPPEVGAGE